MAAGVATRYSDFGVGDDVVLLIHGYLESMDVWEHFAGQLGKTRRVLTLDLPGSGFSDWGGRDVISIDFMAEVASAVMDIAGVRSCTVVGHSMGGYVATALADLFPDKVSRLVLMHSAPSGDSEEKRAYRNREIELVQQGKKELLASINPSRGFAPQNVRRCHEAIEELAEQIMLTHDEAIVATLRGMSERADRTDFFAALGERIPTMIIFGLFDNYISSEARSAIIARYAHASIGILENSGHMGFVEEPEQTLRFILY